MEILKLKTEYAFGDESINYLKDFLLKNNYKKVLLVYGGGSIKKNGLYEKIINNLDSANIEYYEGNGIQANPLDEQIYKIVQENKNRNIDVIIAAGGGSTIDSSKVIASLISNPELKSINDLMINSFSLKNSLPIIAIPTTASTASENNSGSVITITENNKHVKCGLLIPSEIPNLSIEDSKYLISASDWQISAGIFDTFCHNIDEYFGRKTFGWTKEYLFANIRNILNYSLRFLKNKNDIEARDNIMWTSSMSLNALSSFGSNGAWEIHLFEHALSARWNITHGAGNALLTPYYIKFLSKRNEEFKQKAEELAREVFNVETINELIEKLREWIRELGLPMKWSDFKEIAQKPNDNDIEELRNHIVNDPILKFSSGWIKDPETVQLLLESIN